MQISEQLQAELNRLGVKSVYELCRSTVLIFTNRQGVEVEVVVPNPQITIENHDLTIHFHGHVEIGMMTADNVRYSVHTNRWHLHDAPGYSFQGEAPRVSVEILREQRFCLSSDGV